MKFEDKEVCWHAVQAIETRLASKGAITGLERERMNCERQD